MVCYYPYIIVGVDILMERASDFPGFVTFHILMEENFIDNLLNVTGTKLGAFSYLVTDYFP